MPRITKSGPALSTATKLYLITFTVATGVGGGFFVPRCFLRGLTLPIAAPLTSKTAKLFLRLPSRRGCHPVTITPALAVVPWLPRPRHHNAIPPERPRAFPGEFFYTRAFVPPSSIPLAITAVFPLLGGIPGSSHACDDDQRRADYHICLRPGAAGPRQLSATARIDDGHAAFERIIHGSLRSIMLPRPPA